MPERRVLALAELTAPCLPPKPMDPQFVMLSESLRGLVDSKECAGALHTNPGAVRRRAPPGPQLDAHEMDDVMVDLSRLALQMLLNRSPVGARQQDGTSDAHVCSVAHASFGGACAMPAVAVHASVQKPPRSSPPGLMFGAKLPRDSGDLAGTRLKTMNLGFHSFDFAEALRQTPCFFGAVSSYRDACGSQKPLMSMATLMEQDSMALETQFAAPHIAPGRLIRALV